MYSKKRIGIMGAGGIGGVVGGLLSRAGHDVTLLILGLNTFLK